MKTIKEAIHTGHAMVSTEYTYNQLRQDAISDCEIFETESIDLLHKKYGISDNMLKAKIESEAIKGYLKYKWKIKEGELK